VHPVQRAITSGQQSSAAAAVKALGMMINFFSWADGLSGRQRPAGFTQRHRPVTTASNNTIASHLRNSDFLNSHYQVMAAISAFFSFYEFQSLLFGGHRRDLRNHKNGKRRLFAQI
jgi:hypothetical protein